MKLRRSPHFLRMVGNTVITHANYGFIHDVMMPECIGLKPLAASRGERGEAHTGEYVVIG